MSTLVDRTPVESAESEQDDVRQLDQMLARSVEAPAHLTTATGEAVELPPSVLSVLQRAVHHLARGRAVTVVPTNRELTTQQAAVVLNMSRPSLIRLLDEGVIPHTRTGTHRRIRLTDVLAYRRQRQRACRQALDELSRVGAEMGLYDRDDELLTDPDWTRTR